MNHSDEIRKQWHGPFCSAMRLELRENENDLQFDNEHTLSSKPLLIDLLIIKLTGESGIDNEIGNFFLGHNIMEYKSPGSKLNVDTYFKVLGYACFYKAIGGMTASRVRAKVRAKDITLSFVREGYPRKLIRYLRKHGYKVKNRYPGIYYVTGGLFPVQVIVSRELDPKQHRWLRALTTRMDKTQAEEFIFAIKSLTRKTDKENADSVLNVAMQANPELFGAGKENIMCEALMELFQPEVDAMQTRTVDNIIKKYGESLESACQIVGISLEKYQQVKAASQQKSAEVPG